MEPNNWPGSYNQQYGQPNDGSNQSQNPAAVGQNAFQHTGLGSTVAVSSSFGTQPSRNVEVLLNSPQPQQCVYQESVQTDRVFTDCRYAQGSPSVPQQTVQYTSYAPSGENTVYMEHQPAEVYSGAAPVANYKGDSMNQDAGLVSGVHGGVGTTISLEDLAAVCSQDIIQQDSPVTVQAMADSTTDNRMRRKVEEGVNVDTDTGLHDQAPVTVVYEYDPAAYSGQQVEPHQQVVTELPNSGEQIFVIVQGDAAMPVSSVQSSHDNSTDAKDVRVANVAKPSVVKTTVRAATKKPVPVARPAFKRKEPETCGLLSDPTPRPVPHAPKPVPGVSSFQNSFLSFLQGSRQETLSSVTTSAPGKKPVLPKYVPVPKSTVTPKSSEEVKPKSIDEREKPVDAKPPVISSDHSSTSSPVPTAKKIDDISTADSDHSLSTPRPLTVSTPVAARSSTGKSPRRGHPPAKKQRGRPKKIPDPVSDDEMSNSGGEAEEEVVVAPPVVRPTRPVRKAREKIETKRSVVKTKKGKRKTDDSDVSDTDSDDEFLSKMANSEEELNDSDSDPSWNPAAGVDSEKRKPVPDEDGRSRRGRGRGNPGVKRPRVLHEVSSPTARSSPSTPATDATKVTALPGFQRGAFVIERSNLKRGIEWKSRPIWKIDVSRLLKKYEATTVGDRLVHEAKTMYTSWGANDEGNYCVVRVRTVSSTEGAEQVEIVDVGLPPPDPKTDDDLAQPFDVYVQILISQALEPGFLSALRDQQDDYYMGPMKKIDVALKECMTRMAVLLQWTDNFLTSVEHYPYLHIVQSSSLKEHCEAFDDEGQSAIRAVTLSGSYYDSITLVMEESAEPKQKVFSVGALTAKHVTAYHSMHHFKFRLFQTCVAKVNWLKSTNVKEHGEILEKCLQDRDWIQKLHKNLRELQRQSYTVKLSA